MFGLVVILHSLPVVTTGVPTYVAHECALAGPGEIITWRENNLETSSSKLLFRKQITSYTRHGFQTYPEVL